MFGVRVQYRWWMALLALWVGVVALRAADRNEQVAYEALVRMFHDGLYQAVDRNAAQFVQQYTNSERVPTVLLLEAQARMRLGHFDDAATLLAKKAKSAGALADQFAFWRATALLQKGDVAAAAEGFAAVVAQFPHSSRRLEAMYDEAYARFRAGDAARAMKLLGDEKGPFQALAKTQPESEWAVRGWLLLGEVSLSLHENAAAEAALAHLDGKKLPPKLAWQQQFLLAQLKLSQNLLQPALAHATNLWTSVTNQIDSDRLAEAVMVNAQILERLNRPEAALAFYQRNLDPSAPLAERAAALQRCVRLNLRLHKVEAAVKTLQGLLKRAPQDPLADDARLLLAELRLRQYYGLKAKPTRNAEQLNRLLAQAKAQLAVVLTNKTAGALLPRVQLDRGWCFWEAGTNHLHEGLEAFRAAAEKLPRSPDQAVARFKWADCQWLQHELPGAISNYWFVATNYTGMTGFTNTLASQALYQIVRAGVQAKDLGAASEALARLLQVDSKGDLADRSVLMIGQALDRQNKPQAARVVYSSFVQQFTNSTLLPAVRLAIARTYEREQSWAAARKAYADWLGTYGSQTNVTPGLQAQATFQNARLNYQNQPDTNSVQLLLNFVTRFPSNTNAPLAQYLIGEYYYGQADYEQAELSFLDKLLGDHGAARTDGLAFRARLMAGRAAVARGSFRNARDHFSWVITNGPLVVANSPVPVSVAAEAYLLLGDTYVLDNRDGSTNALERYGLAITAFSKVADRFTNSVYAPLAWGRIGDCNLQLAVQDPKRYSHAEEDYRRVIASSADISLRSMAAVGLGIAEEKDARASPEGERKLLLKGALDAYLSVVYGKNKRPGEQSDPYWVKRAGLAAAELAEQQKEWSTALGLYKRLAQELPSLRSRLEKRIAEIQQKQTQSGGS